MSQTTTRTRTAGGTRVPRAAYLLSALAAAAAVAGSLGGLFVHHLYRDDSAWAVAALRGGDLATLVVAVPVLIGALVLARRGSARATLVWLGALGYGVYNFAFYVFGAAFNDIFLVHVVAFAASLYALIVLLPSIDAPAFAGRFRAKTPARVVAVLLILVAVVFAILWTTFSLQYAIAGRLSLGAATLPGMHLVFALDLPLMAPSMAIGGALLWRRRPWGYVLASALCVFGALYQVNLVLAGAFQANAHVEGVRTVDPIGVTFIAAFLVAGVVMLLSLRAERDAGAEIGLPRAA